MRCCARVNSANTAVPGIIAESSPRTGFTPFGLFGFAQHSEEVGDASRSCRDAAAPGRSNHKPRQGGRYADVVDAGTDDRQRDALVLVVVAFEIVIVCVSGC